MNLDAENYLKVILDEYNLKHTLELEISEEKLKQNSEYNILNEKDILNILKANKLINIESNHYIGNDYTKIMITAEGIHYFENRKKPKTTQVSSIFNIYGGNNQVGNNNIMEIKKR